MALYDELREQDLKTSLRFLRHNTLLVYNQCPSQKIAERIWKIYEELSEISEDVFDGNWKDEEEDDEVD